VGIFKLSPYQKIFKITMFNHDYSANIFIFLPFPRTFPENKNRGQALRVYP
jgi:hypothetical protein